MKRILLIGLLINLCCSTRNDNRIDTVATIDQELQLYDHVLTELVRNHFYNMYLGEDQVYELRKQHIYRHDPPDTISYDKEIEKLRKDVESDTSKQRIICLRNELLSGPWKYLGLNSFTDSMKIPPSLRNVMGIVAKDFTGISDTLKIPQRKYSAKDFQPSTFKITSLKELRTCEIGVIGFSKVFFNKMGDQGILYYEFRCGEKCGKGEILVVENKANKWIIKKKLRLWIS